MKEITRKRLAVKDEVIALDDMVWDDPPAKKTPGGNGEYPRLDAFVANLVKTPGKWSRFPEPFNGHPAAQLQKRHPGVEFVARNVDPDDKQAYTVWGRCPEA